MKNSMKCKVALNGWARFGSMLPLMALLVVVPLRVVAINCLWLGAAEQNSIVQCVVCPTQTMWTTNNAPCQYNSYSAPFATTDCEYKVNPSFDPNLKVNCFQWTNYGYCTSYGCVGTNQVSNGMVQTMHWISVPCSSGS